MSETLDTLLLATGASVGVATAVLALTNTISFVGTLDYYLKIKKMYPLTYKREINDHYSEIRGRAKGLFSDQKYASLPGIYFAKNIALKTWM